jgi:nucleotide-binding universal stress UspA family protein
MEPQTGIDAATESPGTPVPRPRVVAGADDSPGARAALGYALIAAARRHAALDIVSAYPVNLPWAWDSTLDAPDVTPVRESVNRAAEELRSATHREVPAVADVAVRVLVGRGTAGQVLVEESGRADLLVVGSRGRGAVQSALLGSVALHCVTAAHCPVVVVHQHAAGDGAPQPTAEPVQEPRVVVGIDGSAESKAALAAALGEAAVTGAVVDALAVYARADFRTDAHRASTPTEDQIRDNVRDRLATTVDAALADLAPAIRSRLSGVRTLVLDGQPTDVLLQQARGAQLLVVGRHGHSVLRGLMLGSVALGCVLRSPCPVMVVHAAPAPDTPAVPTPSRPVSEHQESPT